jgi:hypothetical protein
MSQLALDMAKRLMQRFGLEGGSSCWGPPFPFILQGLQPAESDLIPDDRAAAAQGVDYWFGDRYKVTNAHLDLAPESHKQEAVWLNMCQHAVLMSTVSCSATGLISARI